MTFRSRLRKYVFSERSVRVSDRGEKTVVIFLTCGRMLLAATGAKKLLVNDKITACAKEICRLGVVCKVSNREILSGETFCLPEKRLLSNISEAPWVRN